MPEVIELHRPSPAVEVHDLRKEFSRRDKKAGRFARKKRAALQGVTFTIERGECVAILGQNGSGKSTLVRLLSTLLFHDGGSAEVFGHDVFTDPRPVRKLVNRVSVEASFFKKMSAGENLHYAARYYGMGPRETRVKIPAILTKVGFPIDPPSSPDSYSGNLCAHQRRRGTDRPPSQHSSLAPVERSGLCLSSTTSSAVSATARG